MPTSLARPYDLVTDSWREIAPFGNGGGGRIRDLIWTGSDVVFYVEESVNQPTTPEWSFLQAYDPVDDSYETLSSASDLRPVFFKAMHLIDGELVVELETTGGEPAVLTDTGSFKVVDEGTLPAEVSLIAQNLVTTQRNAATEVIAPTWVGDGAIVGHQVFPDGGSEWQLLHVAKDAPHPLPAPDGPEWWSGASAVWTGEQLIVWGGVPCPPADSCTGFGGPTSPFILTPPASDGESSFVIEHADSSVTRKPSCVGEGMTTNLEFAEDAQGVPTVEGAIGRFLVSDAGREVPVGGVWRVFERRAAHDDGRGGVDATLVLSEYPLGWIVDGWSICVSSP